MSAGLLSVEQRRRIASVRVMATAASVFAASVSLAANVWVLADRGPVGWAVGATAPTVFIFAVELATKTPTGRGGLGRLRAVIAVAIGLGAAFVSFNHLAAVVRSVGETGPVAFVLPVLVDAVVVVGVLTLHDTAAQLRQHERAEAAEREAERAAGEEQARAAAEAAEAAAERDRQRAERAAARTERAKANGQRPGPSGVVGDRPGLEPRERARALAAANPDMTQPEIAEWIGKSERMVRRYLVEDGDGTGGGDDSNGERVEAAA